jgi:hypothetical protein
MDKIKKYEGIILELLKEYATIQPANMAEYENQIIADAERHHYQSVSVGWNKKGHYIYVINFHFDIKSTGKIWLMANNTDALIAQELVKRGVPAADIVLGFQSPQLRQYSEYATA